MPALLRNRLLTGLKPIERERLLPHLHMERLPAQAILYVADERIEHIYFPETSVLCMLTMMRNGDSIESATVGSEGASWISASIGTPTMPCQTMVAVGGLALRISARYVEQEIRRNGAFHNLLSSYAHALLISSLRTGACNALHSLKQRCARWMLVTLDRTNEEDFAMTQEFLASLLGCGRPVLNGILKEFEQAGAVHSTRGAIHIVDRKRLEAFACECYRMLCRVFAEAEAQA